MSVAHTYTFSNSESHRIAVTALSLRLMDARGNLAIADQPGHRAFWAGEVAAAELALADLAKPVA